MVTSIGQPTGLRRFFSNPLVCVLGTVASLLGLVLAILFYLQAREVRDLVYVVHPVRTILARAGHESDLSVQFKGQPLAGLDVVGVQVAIWNDGKKSIREADVLKSVEVRFSPAVQILQAAVSKSSRDVAGLRLSGDSEPKRSGRLPIGWKILE
jgi:hypothetical protein